MTRKTPTLPPGLPSPPQPSTAALVAWAASLGQALTSVFSGITFALNQQPECPTFTVATLPPAANWTARIVFVSDGGAGAKFRASDGSAWINLG